MVGRVKPLVNNDGDDHVPIGDYRQDGEQDQEENGRNNSRQPKVEVNSAQEWKELSAKVQSGEIDTGSMDTGETEGGSIQ